MGNGARNAGRREYDPRCASWDWIARTRGGPARRSHPGRERGAGKNRRQERKIKVVAVDMPSGLASDAQDLGGPVLAADFTVTFTAPKLGQLVLPRSSSCGHLLVRAIGTPPELLESDPHLKINWIEPGEFRALPLARDPEANKGTYGHVLLVAGSLGKSGAAVLASRAALRSGAGTCHHGHAGGRPACGRSEHAGTDDRPAGRNRGGDRKLPEFRLRPLFRGHARQIRDRHWAGTLHAAMRRSNSFARWSPKPTSRLFWMRTA